MYDLQKHARQPSTFKVENVREAIGMTYGMIPIVRPLKVYHAIQASKRCPPTLAAVGIQLLLRNDISAVLGHRVG